MRRFNKTASTSAFKHHCAIGPHSCPTHAECLRCDPPLIRKELMFTSLCIALSLFFWGLWGILDKKALQKSSSQSVIITHYILHALQIPLLVIILCYVHPDWRLTFDTMWWSGLAALAYVVATISYLTAMSRSSASFVLGTTACYPV